MPDKSTLAAHDHEHGFRRGYHDGYRQAMLDLYADSAKHKRRWLQLEKFLEHRLLAWACGWTSGRVMPPSAPRPRSRRCPDDESA